MGFGYGTIAAPRRLRHAALLDGGGGGGGGASDPRLAALAAPLAELVASPATLAAWNPFDPALAEIAGGRVMRLRNAAMPGAFEPEAADTASAPLWNAGALGFDGATHELGFDFAGGGAFEAFDLVLYVRTITTRGVLGYDKTHGPYLGAFVDGDGSTQLGSQGGSLVVDGEALPAGTTRHQLGQALPDDAGHCVALRDLVRNPMTSIMLARYPGYGLSGTVIPIAMLACDGADIDNARHRAALYCDAIVDALAA